MCRASSNVLCLVFWMRFHMRLQMVHSIKLLRAQVALECLLLMDAHVSAQDAFRFEGFLAQSALSKYHGTRKICKYFSCNDGIAGEQANRALP